MMEKEQSCRREFFWLLIFIIIPAGSGCSDPEREALLVFKSGVRDRKGRLSSWRESESCCSWRGVTCSDGKVVKLDLRNTHTLPDNATAALLDDNPWALAGGELHLSLLALAALRHLDLSFNDFGLSPIPEFLGSFRELRYLNLSTARFAGRIPPPLGNLSSLRVLDLGDASVFPFSTMNAGDGIRWIAGLTAATYIDLSWVDLSGAAADDWVLAAVNMLPSLRVLVLQNCGLSSIPSGDLSAVNLTFVVTLDIGFNNFKSTLPDWLWKLTRLRHLDLRSSGFHGSLPPAISNLSSLELLLLGGNSFDAAIPFDAFRSLHGLMDLDLTGFGVGGDIAELLRRLLPEGNLRRMRVLKLGSNNLAGNLSVWSEKMGELTVLDVSNNSLRGSLPESMAKLSGGKLTSLNLSFNSLEGVLNETHFANLPELEILNLAGNRLAVEIEDDEWIPPFQLQGASFRSCRLGPRFPAWLQWQPNLVWLDISDAGIADEVPQWFWEQQTSRLLLLDISGNQIGGRLPETLGTMPLTMLDLSSNRFHGGIPDRLPPHIIAMDLSNNSFSGPLPSSLGTQPFLCSLSLSNNLIGGGVPPSICGVRLYLDLAGNLLTGELPDCWARPEASYLSFLSMASNRLSGEVPASMGSLSKLRSLVLSENGFHGGISPVTANCTELVFLDLGINAFSGDIPPEIGERLTSLVVLRLRSNAFSGELPTSLSRLRRLQVLDLAGNLLTGAIPPAIFAGFEAMASTETEAIPDLLSFVLSSTIPFFFTYAESLLLVMKGKELHYSRTLYLVKTVDLSNNDLTGDMPESVGTLRGLINLNLSSNRLAGGIPEEIEGLRSLESLDLSFNNLSGEIPASMAGLTSLSRLNLSFNNLSGGIPSGDQLQTLDDPSIYYGNPGLCGPPLARNCSDDDSHGDVGGGDDDDEGAAKKCWFIGVAVGFVAGHWAVFGLLSIDWALRAFYFRLIDRMYHRFTHV